MAEKLNPEQRKKVAEAARRKGKTQAHYYAIQKLKREIPIAYGMPADWDSLEFKVNLNVWKNKDAAKACGFRWEVTIGGNRVGCKSNLRLALEKNNRLTLDETKGEIVVESLHGANASNVEAIEKAGESKWIPEFIGLYKVTKSGIVTSHRTKVPAVIKQTITPEGYATVTINGTTRLIHRLVASAFCDGYAEGLTVNHKDLNKLNNHFSNLEWITLVENIQHAWENGACDHIKDGQKRPVEGAHATTGEIIRFASCAEATRNGFDHTNIIAAIRRKGISKGYIWKYADKLEQTGIPLEWR